MKKYYYIGSMGHIESAEAKGRELSLRLRKMMGNYFETELEAEAYIDYLLAKEVIKKDAKGFEPNFTNIKEKKYYGFWDFESGKQKWNFLHITKEPNIYFKTLDNILDSFENHPKEWKTYLTYKQ